MKIIEKTKENECCCTCIHNIRKRSEKDENYIYCECEIDKHFIDYISSFEKTCERWVKEWK